MLADIPKDTFSDKKCLDYMQFNILEQLNFKIYIKIIR